MGSHRSAGMNHQLNIAKMVTTPKITPPYNFKTVSESRKEGIGSGRAHEIERLGGVGKEER